jgi:hypothetical protein
MGPSARVQFQLFGPKTKICIQCMKIVLMQRIFLPLRSVCFSILYTAVWNAEFYDLSPLPVSIQYSVVVLSFT